MTDRRKIDKDAILTHGLYSQYFTTFLLLPMWAQPLPPLIPVHAQATWVPPSHHWSQYLYRQSYYHLLYHLSEYMHGLPEYQISHHLSQYMYRQCEYLLSLYWSQYMHKEKNNALWICRLLVNNQLYILSFVIEEKKDLDFFRMKNIICNQA